MAVKNDHFNTGAGLRLQVMDIKHGEYAAVISADDAFWALVKKEGFFSNLEKSPMLGEYKKRRKAFAGEIAALRSAIKPSAVYFNPTDRCNMDCSYCYIPKNLRRNGKNMPLERMSEAMEKLVKYFRASMPKGRLPQIIFHGAEPLLNKEAVFAVINRYSRDFSFGIQTNGSLLGEEDIEFLTSRKISIGLSLDGPSPEVADRLRKTWGGDGISEPVVRVIRGLKGYDRYSVICTVTAENMRHQKALVDLLHWLEVPVAMLNPLRCTAPSARKHRPDDMDMAGHYIQALDRSYALYKKTGRKLVIANFANVLAAILSPTARRLMCDISPCGGGRCFFAVSASGDIFPCGEFIGMKKFKGGNIFKDDIENVLDTPQFRLVTQRRIEGIEDCSDCAIRHFCGAPCPAEAYAMNGSMQAKGAFCGLYEEQVRYALRLIADGKEDDYLWDGWDEDSVVSLSL